MTPAEELAQLEHEQALVAIATQKQLGFKFNRYFPDCTPACDQRSTDPKKHRWKDLPCRALYRKHLAFLDSGVAFPERLFLAANRIGKTDAAAFEAACHLTGEYPWWWKGKRFDKPVRMWGAGDTMLSTRDILQVALLGPIATYDTEDWCGMIPPNRIIHTSRKSGGVPKCIHEIWVQHKNGGRSMLEFKSFDQGKRLFMGTEQEMVWLDEECPPEIYDECLIRTMTTGGGIMVTFTPLQGLTEFIQDFLQTSVMPDQTGEMRPTFAQFFSGDAIAAAPGVGLDVPKRPTRLVIGGTWDDAPHLSDETKDQLYQSLRPYERDARSKGIPQLGAGAIYPFPESGIRVGNFDIPRHWVRGWGLDCALAGTTAAAWGAIDRDTNVLYLYDVYKRSQAETAVHAEAFKSRGAWIPGVGDAADVIDEDRTRFIDKYKRHGLDLVLPDKAVETGIQDVYDRLSSGTLKVFGSCEYWFAEFRLYQRDDKGRVVKKNDHVLDATRYLVRTGIKRMKIQPVESPPEVRQFTIGGGNGGTDRLNWMR